MDLEELKYQNVYFNAFQLTYVTTVLNSRVIRIKSVCVCVYYLENCKASCGGKRRTTGKKISPACTLLEKSFRPVAIIPAPR